MSTKTQLTTLIAVNLEDATIIPSKRHREVENAIVDNLYPDTLIDTFGVNPIIFSSASPYLADYRLSTKKQGNIVYVTGYFKLLSSQVGAFNLFTIIDSEFNPSSPNSYYGIATDKNGFTVPIRLNVGSASFTVFNEYGRVIPNTYFYFNLFYYTE